MSKRKTAQSAADECSEFRRLEQAYRERFGTDAPVFFMPEDLAIEVMRAALRSGEPAPAEAWPHPGCNCA